MKQQPKSIIGKTNMLGFLLVFNFFQIKSLDQHNLSLLYKQMNSVFYIDFPKY
jgi:hypothetical protein